MKISKLLITSSLIVSTIYFSGCVGNALNSLSEGMKEMHYDNALKTTEDKEMIDVFHNSSSINARISANQIFTVDKLDLINGLNGQSINLSGWSYRPIEFFERNSDEENEMFKLWKNTVKSRDGIIKKYNAKVSQKLESVIYIDNLKSYEQYYKNLSPVFIEYNKNNQMVSSFSKILKTEDLSAVGGIIIEGKAMYNAYEYDIVLLRTNMRKIQQELSNKFLENNELTYKNNSSTLNIKETTQVEKAKPQGNINKNSMEYMIADKFNRENGTDFTTIQEIQEYMSKR